MKYKCPVCASLVSDRSARSVKGHFISGKKKLIYYRACPVCKKDSKFYNEAGYVDGTCWTEFNDSGEPFDFIRDYKSHSFCPINLAQCDNTGCGECVYELTERDLDIGREGCPQRKLFKASDLPIQPNLLSFMGVKV